MKYVYIIFFTIVGLPSEPQVYWSSSYRHHNMCKSM